MIICDEDFMLIDEENHTYEDIIATAYLISHEVSHQVIKILIIKKLHLYLLIN